MTLGVAIVGAGAIGSRRAATAAVDSRLVVVADVDTKRAAVLAARHGGRHTSDWQDAVRDPEVDIVAVCTPNKYLAPISIAALRAGKHVLSEKPMCRNGSEAAEIATVARSGGRVFKVGFTLRFHPAVRKMRELCANGEIGPLFFVNCAYGHGGRAGYEREWRGDPELAGGGELLDQGVHLIDLCRWILGELVVEAAVTRRWYWEISPLEDNALILLRGSKGEVASIHSSWTMWKNRFAFEVVGRDGYARVDGLGGSYGPEILTVGRRSLDGGIPTEEIATYDSPDQSWTEDWRDLLTSIELGRRPEVDAEDGLAIMALVDDLYSAARKSLPAETMQAR